MAIPDNKDPQTQVTDQPYPFVEIQMESVGISAADIQAIKDIQPVSPTDSPTFTGLTLTGDLLAEGYATFNTGMDTLGDIYFAADGKKIIHQGLIIKGGSTQSTHIDCDGGRAFSATATYTDILFGLTKIRINTAGGVVATGALTSTAVVTAKSGTATVAGGTQAFSVGSSSPTFGIYYGSGAPTISAGKGSLYLRTDGSGVNDRMYVNTDDSTTWTAVVTVA